MQIAGTPEWEKNTAKKSAPTGSRHPFADVSSMSDNKKITLKVKNAFFYQTTKTTATQASETEPQLQEEKPEIQPFTGGLANLQIQPVAQQDLKPETKFADKISTPLETPKIKTEPLDQIPVIEAWISTPDKKPKLEPFNGSVQSLWIRPVQEPKPLRHQKKFNCDICQKGVGTKGGLLYHMKAHINGRPFKCAICKRSYATKNDFDTHNQRHSGNIFKCEFCSGIFSAKHYFIDHIKRCHLPKVRKCKYCKNDNYYSVKALKLHIRSCHPTAIGLSKLIYTCKLCGATTSSKTCFQRHALKAKEFNFKCLICLQRFSCMKLLTKHTQTEQKMHTKCNICNGSFLNIRHHMRKHHFTNLVCEFCTFKTKCHAAFAKHLEDCASQDMLRLKGHHCIDCNKYFYSKGSLEIHSSIKHGKLTCPICPYRCHVTRAFKHHMEKHAKNPIRCLCSKFYMFPNMEAFNRHFNLRHKYLRQIFKRPFYGMCYDCISSSKTLVKYKNKCDLEKHMLKNHLNDGIV